MIEQTHEEIIGQVKKGLLEKLDGNPKTIPFTEEGMELVFEAVREFFPVPKEYLITAIYDKDNRTLTFNFTLEDSTW